MIRIHDIVYSLGARRLLVKEKCYIGTILYSRRLLDPPIPEMLNVTTFLTSVQMPILLKDSSM